MKKEQLLETITTLALTLEGIVEDLDRIYDSVHDEAYNRPVVKPAEAQHQSTFEDTGA